MDTQLAPVKFKIGISAIKLPKLLSVMEKTSSPHLKITHQIKTRPFKTVVFIEATGTDEVALSTFKEWAQDFASGIAH